MKLKVQMENERSAIEKPTTRHINSVVEEAKEERNAKASEGPKYRSCKYACADYEHDKCSWLDSTSTVPTLDNGSSKSLKYEREQEATDYIGLKWFDDHLSFLSRAQRLKNKYENKLSQEKAKFEMILEAEQKKHEQRLQKEIDRSERLLAKIDWYTTQFEEDVKENNARQQEAMKECCQEMDSQNQVIVDLNKELALSKHRIEQLEQALNYAAPASRSELELLPDLSLCIETLSEMEQLQECPLLLVPFTEPMILPSGNTVDKVACSKLVASHGKDPFDRTKTVTECIK